MAHGRNDTARPRHHGLTALAAVAAALVVMAGCSGGDDTGLVAASSSSESSSTTTPDAAASSSAPTGEVAATTVSRTDSGDEVAVSFQFDQPTSPESSGADLSALQTCPGFTDRALVVKATATIDVRSSLPAKVAVEMSQGENNPLVYVFNYSDAGWQCRGRAGDDTSIAFAKVPPGQPVSFTTWIVLLNALTPSDPTGDPARLGAEFMMNPPIVRAEGSTDSIPRTFGPKVVSCATDMQNHISIVIAGTVPPSIYRNVSRSCSVVADSAPEPSNDVSTSLDISAAGKPCVPLRDPLPPGAPEVPIPVGPPPADLVVEDVILGTGATLELDNQMTISYIGVACSTGTVVDGTYANGDSHPMTWPLTATGFIQGWVQGLPGMRVGGTRLLGIPPSLGYGSTGSQPNILPDETLWYVVQLQGVG